VRPDRVDSWNRITWTFDAPVETDTQPMGLGVAAVVGIGLLGIGASVRAFSPGVLARFARGSAVDPRYGWVAYIGAVTALVLPAALGAGFQRGDGFTADEYWLFAALGSAVGVYLLAVAASTLADYRLVRDARPFASIEAPAEGHLVAISGVPSFQEDPPESPVAGHPAVYADWLVQARERRYLRATWRSRGGGVETSSFRLDGDRPVVVDPADRVRGTDSVSASFPSGRQVPDVLRPLFDTDDAMADLPNSDTPVRLLEAVVPADEPVTVVGEVTERDGTHRIGDHGTTPLVASGELPAVRRSLRRRVVWAGACGLLAVPVGQVLAVATSAASL